MRIDHVIAKAIKDTRGRPTVEATISANTFTATASVPSGKSTGSHEAVELRDADGGVATACANVNEEIAQAIIGKRFDTPDDLDTFLIQLDGTPNKARLGANAILAVSIAAQRLSAMLAGVPLWKAIAKRANTEQSFPRLYVNVMNGGVHANFALPFQEYILVVEGAPNAAFTTTQSAFKKLGEMLGADTPMGDEGGYAPHFDTLEKPFELLAELVAEYPNTSIAIDAAANELKKDSGYELLDKKYSPDELRAVYRELVERFPFHSIEDPFSEDADDDFSALTADIGEKVFIVGDDFTVTNPVRIKSAIEKKAINAVLIKPNQIGTVKEAIEAVRMTHAAGFKAICSHRSGETDDTFIADFAVGVGAHGIKAGGLGQKQRLEKYERLIAIEKEKATN